MWMSTKTTSLDAAMMPAEEGPSEKQNMGLSNGHEMAEASTNI